MSEIDVMLSDKNMQPNPYAQESNSFYKATAPNGSTDDRRYTMAEMVPPPPYVNQDRLSLPPPNSYYPPLVHYHAPQSTMNPVPAPSTAAPAPASAQPMNIVVNSVASGGGGGGGGGASASASASSAANAAAAMGGFTCPICRVDVIKRVRNRWVEAFIIVTSIVCFPFGLLACILCFTPMVKTTRCTTCKRKLR